MANRVCVMHRLLCACEYYTIFIHRCIDFVQSHMILRNSSICWNETEEEEEKKDVKSHHCIGFEITLQCEICSIHTPRLTLAKFSHSFDFHGLCFFICFFLVSIYFISLLCLAFWLPRKSHLPFLSTRLFNFTSWMSQTNAIWCEQNITMNL